MRDNEFVWRKARASGGQGGNCLEVGTRHGVPVVAIRDTKSRERGHLAVNRETWRAFVGEIKAGRLDLHNLGTSPKERPSSTTTDGGCSCVFTPPAESRARS